MSFSREELKSKRIGLLVGGLSVEREISFRTGSGVAKALESLGYAAISIDVQKDIAKRLIDEKIDVAFIALHGRYGEDGCIQGLLESMFIPYTGSGVLASAAAMDKVFSKHVYEGHGLATPKYVVCRTKDEAMSAKMPFDFPCVVKPSREGSSVGVVIAKNRTEFEAALNECVKYKGDILIEEFIRGRELEGAVLDETRLGVIEIVPSRPFYDYEAKYGANSGTKYIYPAPLEPSLYQKVMTLCFEAHQALSCSGATRSDVILSEKGEAYLLETNTLPGMTPTSLLPKIAAGCGISFEQLCERLLCGASLKA